ncbi:MAG: cyclic nucleotide-binding domain-containing protein [Candidatus Latescibacteria bacterium]|nr:cyclic nucleotide-binding domain-containing protein [Candidatus Latescibacterota bacterium]
MDPNDIQIALLDGLPLEDRKLFFDLATTRSFEDLQPIVNEGDAGDALYVIASGTVRVEKTTLDQQQEVLTSLGDGECFGELSLVDQEPRIATVRAFGGVAEVYEFSQGALDEFFDAHPNLHRKILQNVAKITAQRVRRLDETLVQSFYDSILWLDSNFVLGGWNKLTERRTIFDNAPTEDLIGCDLFDVAPQLGGGVRQTVMQVIASGEMATMALEYADANGAMAYFEITIAPHLDGAVLGFRDITDSKILESRLIQAEKLAMAGQMSAEIGHELKNYLTVLMGHAELMQMNPKLKGDARIERSLGAITEQLSKMEQFASGLMDLAMLRSKTEAAHINLLIEKLILFIQGQSRFHKVEFERDLGTDLPLLDIDPGQIQQVLINLYANAADAMGEGQIETTTRFNKDENRVSVVVVDHGPGMSEEVVMRIFDSGFTTKNTGHGFGLAICARIIENHGGTIDVISEVGVGTTFMLTFPVKAADL